MANHPEHDTKSTKAQQVERTKDKKLYGYHAVR
jgi:hypothetical protein